ncbi:MAG: ABC transporter permease [Candidatus Shapirobacteria bacterium]|nr:ABC transporter permease [Candidatus Shapirobacteria bacterium]MDD4410140.1 ABC transporter permease [Candidatus Shapirobacteria bacterium]
MIEFLEFFKESINTLRLNKMRTGLAILGIIIGIGSVIALVSIGQSSQAAVTSQITALGSNLITVSPGAQSSGRVRTATARKTLTLADADALKIAALSAVKAVSPEYSSRLQVVTSDANTNTTIYGAVSTYSEIHNLKISGGRFITDSDYNSNSHVAVLGPTVVEDLFGSSSYNPIGETIRINGQNFTVIGVTVAKGSSGMTNSDDAIYVPLSTAMKQLFGVNYLSSIAVQAASSDVMIQAQNQIGYLLLARHKLTDTTKADFTIRSQEDILSTASSVTGTFTSLLSGVAAISLIVGGIGIMNIMLVTVTERTREIGLRKALGAKKKTIITQFLFESVILTFTGGILGIILGIAISYGYSRINSSVFTISPTSVLLAFVVSVVIGIIFGWYPAKRAASLQPIEALRYE